MGAHNIEYQLRKSKFPTTGDVRNWYERVVGEAVVEYGTDPYNGTISTTRGVKFSDKKFTDYDEASEYVLDNTNKWGAVLCVTYVCKGEEFWFVGGWAAE